MSAELILSDDGILWLLSEDGEDCRSRLLGSVGDPATSYRVPGDLLGRLGELEREWRKAVEFGDACRAEAIDTYRRNAL
jgi:hypothetical protein